MGFGNGLEDDEHVMSEINMTPLVDVMLVLLVIFIITVPVLTHSLKVDLPHVSNEPTVERNDTIRIIVFENGRIQWNDAFVNQEMLEQKLRAVAVSDPQPEIHIYGERKAEYEKVLKVMRVVQGAGIRKMGFITEPKV